MSYTTEQIRNVALAGHPGAGKTILFEALLHAGGTIQTAGTIERGTTVSDFDPIEKDRSHSIDAAIASVDHATAGQQPVHVNLIDTPGYPDFRGPTLSALAAVETVAIVVDADTGVGYGTRRMMDYAKARNLCRVIVVNKIDHPGAKLDALLDELRDAFGDAARTQKRAEDVRAEQDSVDHARRSKRLAQRVPHDREEVRTALLDLEGTVYQLGGIVTMSAVREQVAPDDYITTGVLLAYDSFAPTREREHEPEPDEIDANSE